MKRNLITAVLYTLLTTIILGLGYPLVITAIAHLATPQKAEGQLILRNGKVIGSSLIAQPFTGDAYFHPRPSAAGANGYDAANSGGSNYGPTNQKLVDRVSANVAKAHAENSDKLVPIDLVTTSASGLDPDITPANAEFQAARVAHARHVPVEQVFAIVNRHTLPRQFGIFGELRVNVLELNLALNDALQGVKQ